MQGCCTVHILMKGILQANQFYSMCVDNPSWLLNTTILTCSHSQLIKFSSVVSCLQLQTIVLNLPHSAVIRNIKCVETVKRRLAVLFKNNDMTWLLITWLGLDKNYLVRYKHWKCLVRLRLLYLTCWVRTGWLFTSTESVSNIPGCFGKENTSVFDPNDRLWEADKCVVEL